MLKLINLSPHIIDSFPRLFRMKTYTNKTSFVGPEVPKAHGKKISINFMIFILIIVEIWLLYQAKHYFSVLHRAGSNPADINRFGSHTGIGIYRIVL